MPYTLPGVYNKRPLPMTENSERSDGVGEQAAQPCLCSWGMRLGFVGGLDWHPTFMSRKAEVMTKGHDPY